MLVWEYKLHPIYFDENLNKYSLFPQIYDVGNQNS
jgi:hypothetical protein